MLCSPAAVRESTVLLPPSLDLHWNARCIFFKTCRKQACLFSRSQNWLSLFVQDGAAATPCENVTWLLPEQKRRGSAISPPRHCNYWATVKQDLPRILQLLFPRKVKGEEAAGTWLVARSLIKMQGKATIPRGINLRGHLLQLCLNHRCCCCISAARLQKLLFLMAWITGRWLLLI